MPTYNEITLAKELIKFPSVTPIDAGVMKFLAKKLTAIGFLEVNFIPINSWDGFTLIVFIILI